MTAKVAVSTADVGHLYCYMSASCVFSIYVFIQGRILEWAPAGPGPRQCDKLTWASSWVKFCYISVIMSVT